VKIALTKPQTLIEAMKHLHTLLALSLFSILIPNTTIAGYDEGLSSAQKGDFATALREWKPLADQGNSRAQYNLGLMSYEGQGVAQDYKEAARWYRLAADQGHVRAQYNLGVMYANGQGVAQDYKEAVRLYRLAADQSNARAQSSLGVMYANGQGVAQSRVVAYALCNLSAAGDPFIEKTTTAIRAHLAESMNSKEIEAAQDLARELAKPKNLLKGLDMYNENPTVKE
jgi:TPR repeat protein